MSEVHGPGHAGCATCDPSGGQPARAIPRPSVVRIAARGEEFRIVQVVGNLFVCSRVNGNCCCGWAEKGRMPFDNALWSEEWDRRKIRSRVHLTFSGCLGPCAVGNNALLQIWGRSIWLNDLNEPHLVGVVFDYIEAMLGAGSIIPVPDALAGHVYERYLTPSEPAPEMTFGAPGVDGSVEGLDPVCFMEVDLATTRHKLDYDGRTIGFCAPSCKKLFQADPAAYLGARN